MKKAPAGLPSPRARPKEHPLSEQSIPQETTVSTPTPTPAQRALHREEELLRRFNEASRAYYLMAEADRPERLEAIGRQMDEAARELRS